ncbi:MAG: hypothetical protein ABEJ02_04570 [Candidatus Paceibacteria bacterium]
MEGLDSGGMERASQKQPSKVELLLAGAASVATINCMDAETPEDLNEPGQELAGIIESERTNGEEAKKKMIRDISKEYDGTGRIETEILSDKVGRPILSRYSENLLAEDEEFGDYTDLEKEDEIIVTRRIDVQGRPKQPDSPVPIEGESRFVKISVYEDISEQNDKTDEESEHEHIQVETLSKDGSFKKLITEALQRSKIISRKGKTVNHKGENKYTGLRTIESVSVDIEEVTEDDEGNWEIEAEVNVDRVGDEEE